MSVGTHARTWVRWLRDPGQRLSQRTVHAVFWASAMRLGLRSSTLVKTVVLARLLAPGDFGLMGIAILMASLMENFTLTGFDKALIQRKGDIRPYLDTAWTVEALRGLGTCALLVAAAPLIGAFFGEPRAVLVVQVMGVTLLLRGLANIGIVFFQRELELHRRFTLQMLETVADVAVAMALAVVLRDVWALVYGALAGSAVRVVGSFALHPFRPRPRLAWGKARELFAFGKWVLGSSSLLYLLESLDRLVVGKLLGAASLGLYQLAWKLSQFTGKELMSLGRLVAFPAYAKLQEQRSKLGGVYLEGVSLVGLVSLPLAAGMLVLSPYAVPPVLGEQWAPMVPALQALAVVGLVESLNAGTPFLFEALGQPQVTTKLYLGRLFLMAVLLYPLTAQLGLLGSALAVAGGTLAMYPIGLRLALRAVGLPAGALLRALGVPLVGTLAMAGVVAVAARALPAAPNVGHVAGLVALGCLAYLAAVVALDHLSGRRIRRTLRRRFAIG